MFETIYTILKSKNSGTFTLKVLILLFILYILYLILVKFKRPDREPEGFTQTEPFVLKRNDKIYDDFYSHVYDDIHIPKHRVGFELMHIINMTEPSSQNSVFLDIGSGTGNVVNELKEAGYNAYGIDKSEDMVTKSEEKYPKCNFKCADVKEPMTFEKSTFSHIICTYFTIYHFEDKRTFFENSYFWLRPNGYLILHLVDKQKYDTLAPVAKISLEKNPHKFASSRITDSIVEFPDFEYKCIYKFENNSNRVNKTEVFKDNKTSNIRQNEETLHMENPEEILSIASNVGFIIKGKFDMKECNDDENQFIYILEKI
jgi:SAM-dependent methyltransferase